MKNKVLVAGILLTVLGLLAGLFALVNTAESTDEANARANANMTAGIVTLGKLDGTQKPDEAAVAGAFAVGTADLYNHLHNDRLQALGVRTAICFVFLTGGITALRYGLKAATEKSTKASSAVPPRL